MAEDRCGHLILLQAPTRPRGSGIEWLRDRWSIRARFPVAPDTDPLIDYDRACDLDERASLAGEASMSVLMVR